MKYRFSDELNTLFRNFYLMSGGVNISMFASPVHVSQYDTTMNFANCLAYPSTTCDVFCQAIRGCAKIDAMCLACDAQHIEQCRMSGKILTYRCFLGMWEGLIPVHIEGENAAILFIGQVSDTEKSDAHFERLWRGLRKSDHNFFCDGTKAAFRTYYDHIHYMTQEQFEATCSFLSYISRDWYEQGLVSLVPDAPNEALYSYINGHLGTDIRVEDVCENLHISRATVYRMIKQDTGLGFNSYINKCKIERACTLLRHGFSVSRAAEQVGFENVNYFSRVFKNEIGVSPREYHGENKRSDK